MRIKYAHNGTTVTVETVGEHVVLLGDTIGYVEPVEGYLYRGSYFTNMVDIDDEEIVVGKRNAIETVCRKHFELMAEQWALIEESLPMILESIADIKIPTQEEVNSVMRTFDIPRKALSPEPATAPKSTTSMCNVIQDLHIDYPVMPIRMNISYTFKGVRFHKFATQEESLSGTHEHWYIRDIDPITGNSFVIGKTTHQYCTDLYEAEQVPETGIIFCCDSLEDAIISVLEALHTTIQA